VVVEALCGDAVALFPRAGRVALPDLDGARPFGVAGYADEGAAARERDGGAEHAARGGLRAGEPRLVRPGAARAAAEDVDRAGAVVCAGRGDERDVAPDRDRAAERGALLAALGVEPRDLPPRRALAPEDVGGAAAGRLAGRADDQEVTVDGQRRAEAVAGDAVLRCQRAGLGPAPARAAVDVDEPGPHLVERLAHQHGV